LLPRPPVTLTRPLGIQPAVSPHFFPGLIRAPASDRLLAGADRIVGRWPPFALKPWVPLLFKGGTALRKCYVGDNRLPEDPDFTALGSVPTGPAMESAMQQACARTVKLLGPYAPVEIG